MTPTLAAHLDGCLGCLNCERACPSEVDFAGLIDGAKAMCTTAMPASRRHITRLLLGMLSSARGMAILSRFARLADWSGVARLAEHPVFARFPWLAPYRRLTGVVARTRPAPRATPLHTSPPPAAELFLGCTAEALQGSAVAATLRVAARLGAPLRVAAPASCCGAMLRHNGFPAAADATRARALGSQNPRQLVGLASACVAELREDPAAANPLELCDYLDGLTWPETASLQRIAARVLVHEPCSHRNRLGGNGAVHRLLARIPGLDLQRLPPGDGCCGAAGTYLLQQPRMAEALLDRLLEPIRARPPEVIVTTNPGCALHLAAGVRDAGLAVEILHPVELIDRALAGPRSAP